MQIFFKVLTAFPAHRFARRIVVQIKLANLDQIGKIRIDKCNILLVFKRNMH